VEQMTKLLSALVWGSLFFCFIGFGCEKKAHEAPAVKTAPDKEESLQEKVASLERDLLQLRMQVNAMSEGSATVSTEEKGYSIAQTKYGSFAIVCKNATPYLDGYKVQLSIGNLTSAQFKGAKIHLIWGKSLTSSKDMSVTNSFLSGRYTTVELVMTPAKPEDIKKFIMILDFDQIALF
jgi:hypothetical protein